MCLGRSELWRHAFKSILTARMCMRGGKVCKCQMQPMKQQHFWEEEIETLQNRISSFVPCWPTQIFTTGSCNQPPPDGGWFSVLTYPSWGALPFNPFENLPEDFSPLRHGNPASKIHKFVIQRYNSCAHLWVETSEVDSGMRRSMCTYHSTFTPCSLDAFGLMPRCGTGWLAGWQLMLALRTHQRVAGALQTTVSWCRLMWDAIWTQDVTPTVLSSQMLFCSILLV